MYKLPLIFLCALCQTLLFSQIDSLNGFSESKVRELAYQKNVLSQEYPRFLLLCQREFINTKYHLSSNTQNRSETKYNSSALPAVNIDFETGSFNGWNLFYGLNAHSVNQTCNYNSGQGNSALISGGVDPLAPITLTSPLGGNFVARVNNNVASMQQSMIRNKISVTTKHNLLKFAYAAVLQKAGHFCHEQPYFAVTLRDTLGNLLFNYFVEAYDTLNTQSCKGYNQENFLATSGGLGVRYSPWKVKCVDLTAYLNQNIFLEVIGGSCTLSGHYGYGYFDAKLESCPDFNTPNILTAGSQSVSLDKNYTYLKNFNCTNQFTPLTVTAPSWASYRNWNGPAGSNIISTNSPSISVINSGLHTLSLGNNSVCPITKSIFIETSTSTTMTVVADTTLCINTPAYFWASGMDSYSWSNGQAGPTTTMMPSATGVYTMSVTGYNANSGCTYLRLITYTVFTNPTVSISGNSTVCPGSTLTLSGSGANIYNWYGLCMTPFSTVTANGATAAFTPTGNTTYYLTGKDANGCETKTSLSVTLMPQPAIFASIALNNGTVCPGYTSSVTLTGNGNTFTISNGAGTFTTGNQLVLTPTATTVYTATAMSVCGMANSTFTIYTNPIVPPVTINSSGTLCSSNFALNSSGATSYTWTSPTGSFATTNNLTFFSGSGGVYTLTGVTSPKGCIGTTTANIITQATPTVAISPSLMCSGATSTLTLTGGGSIYTVMPSNLWGALVSPSFTTSGTFTYNPPGNFYYFQINTSVNGCSSGNNLIVPVYGQPTLSISSNASVSCIGSPVTLVVSGSQSYTWSTGSNSSSIVVSPTATTVYSVSTVNGCGSDTKSITVNSLNVSAATLSITPLTPTLCANTFFTVAASGANTYTWLPSNSTGSTLSALNTQSFMVKGTDNNGCVGTGTLAVSFQPNLTGTISGVVTTCSNSPKTYTALGMSTYSWNTGSTSYTTTFTPPGTLSVTGLGSNGCPLQFPPTLNTSIYYPPLNPPSIQPSGTPSVCAKNLQTLYIHDPLYSAPLYTWSTGMVNTPIIYVNPSVTTTYSLIASYAPPSCTFAVLKTVFVYPVTTPSFVASSYSACENQSSITFTPSPAGSIMAGQGIMNNTFNSGIAGTHSIYASYTDTNNCTYKSLPQVITVFPKPIVQITSFPSNACMNASVSLAGAPGGGAFFGAGISGSVYTPTTTAMSSITYFYIDANGCSNYDHKCVNVYSPPNLNFASSSQPICAGQSVTLSVTGANAYTWSPGGMTNTSVVVSPSTSTTYTVIGTNQACQNSGTVPVNVNACTSVSEYSLDENVSIFPNPSSGVFNVSFEGQYDPHTKLQVYNSNGALILTEHVTAKSAIIDLSSKAKGIYIVRISSLAKKIVKQ